MAPCFDSVRKNLTGSERLIFFLCFILVQLRESLTDSQSGFHLISNSRLFSHPEVRETSQINLIRCSLFCERIGCVAFTYNKQTQKCAVSTCPAMSGDPGEGTLTYQYTGELSRQTRYNPITNTCYQVSLGRTWDEALSDCETAGGYLFILETQQLIDWFNSEFQPTHANWDFWTGAFSRTDLSVVTFLGRLTGDAETQLWHEGHYSEDTPPVCLYMTTNYGWNQHGTCSVRRGYICEYLP